MVAYSVSAMNALRYWIFWLGLLPVAITLVSGCSEQAGFQIVPEHKDLGAIQSKDRIVIATFELVNGLSVPVNVENIYPSCTCTSVKLEKNPIPAKEKANLVVTADLSKLAGRHKFSVRLITDNPDFPIKQVSFDAIAPAVGTRERAFSIGTFYPGAVIDMEIPVNSITLGSIEQLNTISGEAGITAQEVKRGDGKSVFAIKGTAPHSPGMFSQKVLFREAIPGNTAPSEGRIELELSGSVVARWAVQREYYCGFLRFDTNDPMISVDIARNAAIEEQRNDIVRVLVTHGEGWLSLINSTTGDSQIRLRFGIDKTKMKNFGASQVTVHRPFV